MLQTQQIDLNQEEFDKLFEFYEKHQEHYVRQRAQILLLRHQNYTVSTIAEVLWLEKNYISLYIKAWYHFGIEGFLSNDTEKLYNRIKEIETSEQVEVKPLLDWSKIYGFISKLVRKVYTFFEKIVLSITTFFLTIFIKLITRLKAIDYKKFYVPLNQSLSNKLSIGRDSNNNIVFQMINVFNGDKDPEYSRFAKM